MGLEFMIVKDLEEQMAWLMGEVGYKYRNEKEK